MRLHNVRAPRHEQPAAAQLHCGRAVWSTDQRRDELTRASRGSWLGAPVFAITLAQQLLTRRPSRDAQLRQFFPRVSAPAHNSQLGFLSQESGGPECPHLLFLVNSWQAALVEVKSRPSFWLKTYLLLSRVCLVIQLCSLIWQQAGARVAAIPSSGQTLSHSAASAEGAGQADTPQLCSLSASL